MSHIDVLNDYVGDVIRHLPKAMQDDVGFELRELLLESLNERAESAGRAPDDPMVLDLLREFGAPADVAARYQPPGPIILRADQTQKFVRASLIGIAVQWAFTLPTAFRTGTLGGWWLSAGLGALWWPGALIMGAAATSWLRHSGVINQSWQPRMVDREQVDRRTTKLGLAAFVAGVATIFLLPWLVQVLPAPVARTFAFDADFLRARAPLIVPLWAAAFGIRLQALRDGRRSPGLRMLDVATSLAVVALLTWWLLAGAVFREAATDAGAKPVLGLVIVLVVIDLVASFVRRRPKIHAPERIR